LLLIGADYDRRIKVIMNYGNSSPKIIKDTVIRYYSKPEVYSNIDEKKNNFQFSDLSFKHDNFIEHNSSPKKFSIERITNSTSGYQGSCPVFKLIIEKNRAAILRPNNFLSSNKAKGFSAQKTFTASLKNDVFETIVNLHNYIDFPNLNEYYAEPTSDLQGCKLEVAYSNGMVKMIYD